MRTAEAVALLRDQREALHARGIAHLALFGSVARDEAGPESDVDLVVEPEPGRPITLFTIGPLHDLFAALLGRPVNVVAKSGFDASEALKRQAGPDLVVVF